ncbi:MAG TPA: hypothetical protein VMQ93_10820 [Novosphingobium sp.]|nr:hypothetical protein [Novosphingobium sp.]
MKKLTIVLAGIALAASVPHTVSAHSIEVIPGDLETGDKRSFWSFFFGF